MRIFPPLLSLAALALLPLPASAQRAGGIDVPDSISTEDPGQALAAVIAKDSAANSAYCFYDVLELDSIWLDLDWFYGALKEVVEASPEVPQGRAYANALVEDFDLLVSYQMFHKERLCTQAQDLFTMEAHEREQEAEATESLLLASRQIQDSLPWSSFEEFRVFYESTDWSRVEKAVEWTASLSGLTTRAIWDDFIRQLPPVEVRAVDHRRKDSWLSLGRMRFRVSRSIGNDRASCEGGWFPGGFHRIYESPRTRVTRTDHFTHSGRRVTAVYYHYAECVRFEELDLRQFPTPTEVIKKRLEYAVQNHLLRSPCHELVSDDPTALTLLFYNHRPEKGGRVRDTYVAAAEETRLRILELRERLCIAPGHLQQIVLDAIEETRALLPSTIERIYFERDVKRVQNELDILADKLRIELLSPFQIDLS